MPICHLHPFDKLIAYTLWTFTLASQHSLQIHSTKQRDGRQELQYHEIDFVVNRAPGKLYIQSAWRLPTDEKREQELLPLRRSGDFFARIVVMDGVQPPMKDDLGIVHVGVIPFLLDESILDTALETSRS